MAGCKTCSTEKACTTCIDDDATNEGDKCSCEHGMNGDGTCKKLTCKDTELKVSQTECTKCSDLMEGCKTCTSDSSCTKCIDDKATNEVTKCTCKHGMNGDGTCKEISCKYNELKVSISECIKCSEFIEGCETCTAKDTCTKCIDDKAKNEGDKCVCSHGFNEDGTCKEITCKSD